MKESDEVKGILKFYEEELEVLFPVDYSTFKTQLGEMLSLTDDSLQNFQLVYKGAKNNKVEIKNVEDYKKFINYIEEKIELVTLEVEVKEVSNINIKNCKDSIILFKKKSFPGNNINNDVDKNINNINNINNDINNNINNNIIERNRQYNIMSNDQRPNLAFPVACSFCRVEPLYKIIYYCKECKIIFCSNCEAIKGSIHPHSYYKVQNTSQYEYLNIGVQTGLEKMIDKVGNKVGEAYNSVLDFLGVDKIKNQNVNNYPNQNINNIYQNNNIQRPQVHQQSNLIEMARSQYDLGNISDERIEEALRQTNGNIDNAVVLLISQS